MRALYIMGESVVAQWPVAAGRCKDVKKLNSKAFPNTRLVIAKLCRGVLALCS